MYWLSTPNLFFSALLCDNRAGIYKRFSFASWHNVNNLCQKMALKKYSRRKGVLVPLNCALNCLLQWRLLVCKTPYGPLPRCQLASKSPVTHTHNPMNSFLESFVSTPECGRPPRELCQCPSWLLTQVQQGAS